VSGSRGAAVQRLRSALEDRGGRVDWRSDSGMAQCPAEGHDDRTASLSVAQGDCGAVVFCQAGCDTGNAILPALGLAFPDLFDNPPGKRKAPPLRVVAEYRYTDERGELLFVKERQQPKDFRVKRPDGRGGWAWRLGRDTRRVLYQLPEVRAAVQDGRTVYLVEGEKDVDRLRGLGHVATCNFDGAAKEGQRVKWRSEYGDALRGADVVIIADRDDAGIAHAKAARADLSTKAKSAVIMLAAVTADHADVSDHLDTGHTLDELVPLAAETEPASADDSGDREAGRGPSQAAVLAQLAEERYRLLGSEDGRPYAVKRGGANIALLLRGKGALRSELAKVYADVSGGRVPSASALTDALTVLEGRAAAKDAEPVYLRLAHHDGCIVIDLGTADGRCVVISANGWSREPRSPVLFRRTKLTSPIPEPVRDGNGLDKLRDLLNAEEKEFRLIVGWLVAALIPGIPHPILALRGEQGAAKSSTAQMIVEIIDPSPAPLRSVPRDMKQWAVAASASWAVALDNVSQIPGWLSDTLCKAVTGDGYVDRVLYSDDDVTVLAFRRAVILTSIDPGALAGDLAERLLVVELQPILDSKRRAEAEVRQVFADARPPILAALLDLLGKVLAELPGLSLDRMPRMADFARILAAVDSVQQWETLKDYLNASTDVAADVLEGDAFARAVIRLAADRGKWTGTATELLGAVITPEPMPKTWPKDPTRTGGQLKRVATALRAVGIEVTEDRSADRNRTRMYTIMKQPDEGPSETGGDTASAASAASGTASDQQELADATALHSVRASVRTSATADAADTAADTGHPLASAPHMPPDLREWSAADAADAADAGITTPISAAPCCGECGAPEDSVIHAACCLGADPAQDGAA
jgi:hypothetical protein